MSKHVLEWLPAYYDGELPSRQLQEVENHLQECPGCRSELQMLASLSRLLKADPAPQHVPAERFAAQIQLLLPRNTTLHSKAERLPRWVLGVPLALIVLAAFLQAALWVASLILTTSSFFPEAALWFAPEGNFDAGALLLLNIALLFIMTIFWGTWMAFWQAWKHNQPEYS